MFHTSEPNLSSQPINKTNYPLHCSIVKRLIIPTKKEIYHSCPRFYALTFQKGIKCWNDNQGQWTSLNAPCLRSGPHSTHWEESYWLQPKCKTKFTSITISHHLLNSQSLVFLLFFSVKTKIKKGMNSRLPESKLGFWQMGRARRPQPHCRRVEEDGEEAVEEAEQIVPLKP